MKALSLHPWRISPAEAQVWQRKLAARISQRSEVTDVRFIAGVDVSAPGRQREGRGAVVILSYPDLELVEVQVIGAELTFPYIPGLLSFRETPALLGAFEALKHEPDLIIVDGQGIAHPRRLGIAAHLGLLFDVPTIGCAKSRLIGEHEVVGREPGSWVELRDGDDIIGAVMRTKPDTKPLYVSVGHKVDLKTAREWVLLCCRGYRLPEPTRLAHQAAGGTLRLKPTSSDSGFGEARQARLWD